MDLREGDSENMERGWREEREGVSILKNKIIMPSKNRMRQVKVKSAVGWRDFTEPFLLSGR